MIAAQDRAKRVRWLPVATAFVFVSLIPAVSSAQEGCQFYISVMADAVFITSQPEPNLSVSAEGIDWSYCPPPILCQHVPTTLVFASLPTGLVSRREPGMLIDIAVTAPPGSAVPYGAALDVDCSCAQNTFTANYQNVINIPQQSCAIPQNYRVLAGPRVLGPELQWDYTWDSSSGNVTKADLANCRVGELVTYIGQTTPAFVWPAPFPEDVWNNPADPDIAGSANGIQDTHHIPNGSFRQPYFDMTVNAVQYYRFHCPCHQNDAWVNLMGPIPIERTVERPTGDWRYRITKDNASALQYPLP